MRYLDIAAGDLHSAARRSDGSLVMWGIDTFGVLQAPPLPPGLTYTDVALGRRHRWQEVGM